MKRKLEINGKEVEVEIISKSADGITFILSGKEYSFSSKGSGTGKAILTDPQNKSFTVYSSGDLFDCSKGQFKIRAAQRAALLEQNSGNGFLHSPLPGKVVKVLAKAGQKIKEGDVILHIEAMKMEHRICAEISGTLKALNVKEGDAVSDGQALGEIA